MTTRLTNIIATQQSVSPVAPKAHVAVSRPGLWDFGGRRELKEAEKQMNSIAINSAVKVYETEADAWVQEKTIEIGIGASARQSERLAFVQHSTLNSARELTETFVDHVEATYRSEMAQAAKLNEDVATERLTPEVAASIMTAKHGAYERLRTLGEQVTATMLDVKMRSIEAIANSRTGPRQR